MGAIVVEAPNVAQADIVEALVAALIQDLTMARMLVIELQGRVLAEAAFKIASEENALPVWGVWHDAGYVADQITIQRGYRAHNEQVAASR